MRIPRGSAKLLRPLPSINGMIKIGPSILGALALGTLPSATNGQGIINGGFENYDPNTEFLPSWHVRVASTDLGVVVNGASGSRLGYETDPHEQFMASIYGKASSLDGIPIGNYWLFAYGLMGGGEIVAEQKLKVPADIESLQYRAFYGYPSQLMIKMDGQLVEPYLKAIVVPGGNVGIVADWWMDVSAYAGKEVTLSVILGTRVGLDEIRFSPEAIPEPSTLAILGVAVCGGLVMGRRNMRRIKNSVARNENSPVA